MSNERMSLNDIQRALMKALYRPGSPVTSNETDAAMDALGGLVAAEADGRLVRLPCKVGDTVYLLVDEKITAWEVTGIELRQFYESIALKRGRGGSMEKSYVLLSLWGEIAFYTRAEAETALKEREARHGRTIDKAQC